MNDLNENKVLEENENLEEKQEIEENVENEEKKETEESLELESEESLDLDSAKTEEDAVEELPPMEPIVEVETTYDYKVLKYCNMYVIKVKRHSTVINLVMALISIAIGGLILYSSIKNKNHNYIFAIMTFLLSIWVIISIFSEERRIDKSLINYFKTHAPVKQKFSFDKEKIRISAVINGEERQADYPWAYVSEIHAIPEYFFLFINGGSPIVLDRSEEAVVTGTMEDLEELIREECSLKPFKQYLKPLVKKLADVKYYTPVEETTEEKVEDNTLEENNDKEEDKNE